VRTTDEIVVINGRRIDTRNKAEQGMRRFFPRVLPFLSLQDEPAEMGWSENYKRAWSGRWECVRLASRRSVHPFASR
jgi:hypothetical protein